MSEASKIKFQCPACGSGAAVPHNYAGLVIKCPSCREFLLAPQETGGPVEVVTEEDYEKDQSSRDSAGADYGRKKSRSRIFWGLPLLLLLCAGGAFFVYRILQPSALEVEVAEVTQKFQSGQEVVLAFLEAETAQGKAALSEQGGDVLAFLKQVEEWGIPMVEEVESVVPLTDHTREKGALLTYQIRFRTDKDDPLSLKNGQMLVHETPELGFRVNAVRWFSGRHRLLERFEKGEFGDEAIFPLILKKRSLLETDRRLLQGQEGVGLLLYDLEQKRAFSGLAYAKGEDGEILNRFVHWDRPSSIGVKLQRVELLGQVRLWVTKVLR